MITIPTYEYKCPNCGIIEHNKKMIDPELEKCPTCESEVKRIYNTGGVRWNCEGSYSKVNS